MSSNDQPESSREPAFFCAAAEVSALVRFLNWLKSTAGASPAPVAARSTRHRTPLTLEPEDLGFPSLIIRRESLRRRSAGKSPIFVRRPCHAPRILRPIIRTKPASIQHENNLRRRFKL
jgi:hypothetical protein